MTAITRPLIVPLALCVLALAPVTAGAESRVSGDFNGDGFDDLAVGVRGEGLGSAMRAGTVNVIYGSSSRLTTTGNRIWDQNSAGIAGGAEQGDTFGSALAVGDFNGDGFDDLAVGVPGEALGSVLFAGAVNVIYGSASRLTATGNQLWHQDSSGIADMVDEGDLFGSSLTAGDFNGDGFDDLTVGAPGENLGSTVNSGAVNVIYGSAARLTATGDQGIAGVAETGAFGDSLAAGDFNGDEFEDLAVGVPFTQVGAVDDAGAVNVIYGSASRLDVSTNQLWHQDSSGIAEVAATEDGFASSLAAGDFNASGHDDLAVGVPGEDVGRVEDAGAVNVIYGAGIGLRATDNQLWHQDSTGIVDAAESVDGFGSALTAADFNASGHDDLAAGVGENPGGAVSVIYGSANRLRADGNQLWSQDSAGIADAAEFIDGFGGWLTAGDFNGGGHDDLAAGVQGEDVDSVFNAGAVNVIYGAGVGLRANGNQLWHQDSPGIAGVAERDDNFAQLPG